MHACARREPGSPGQRAGTPPAAGGKHRELQLRARAGRAGRVGPSVRRKRPQRRIQIRRSLNRMDASKPVVLIVDDAPESIDVLRGVLGAEYQVKAAIHGAVALELVQATPPDLILLDVMM